MFDTTLQQLAAIAVLVERGVQFAKTIFQYNNWAKAYQQYIDTALNVGFNVVLCFSWHVDLFSVAGINLPAVWLGPALTGVVASFGSTVVHELVEILKAWRAGVPAFKKK